MSNPLPVQLLLLAATLLTGLGLGLVYDLLRVIRQCCPAPVGVAADALFCLIFAAALFLLGMGPAGGTLRFYMPPLALGGAGVWFFFFGAAARRLFVRLLRAATFPARKLGAGLRVCGKKMKKGFSFLQKRFTIILQEKRAARAAALKRRNAGESTDETETGKYIYKDCDPRADRLRDGHAGEHPAAGHAGRGRPGGAAGAGGRHAPGERGTAIRY